MQSVSIDGKDLYTEYGFLTASVEIQQPSAQTKFVSIPMRDGSVDLTNAVSDAVRYKDRVIKINLFRMTADESVLSSLASYLNGQKRQIIFSIDIGYYYLGRISIESVNRVKGTMSITLNAECEPFKYDVNTSDVDWDWDTFDLVNGVINEANQLVVSSGEAASFTLICRRDREFPLFTWTSSSTPAAACTMTYKNRAYTIPVGTHKLYNVFFDNGENELSFSGNGLLTIKYRGGSL